MHVTLLPHPGASASAHFEPLIVEMPMPPIALSAFEIEGRTQFVVGAPRYVLLGQAPHEVCAEVTLAPID